MPRSNDVLTRDEARAYLVGHQGLRAFDLPRGARGVRKMLERQRCIQLDPLDVIGTNADLVALARVDGIQRGDVYRHLFPRHAFEHFAKERCILPASAFPHYRDGAALTTWWRLESRLPKLAPAQLDAVLDEVRRDGPMTSRELKDHGRVEPIDWSGWKGTSRATLMALEVLWTRCEVVIAGRRRAEKLYDVPERALPNFAKAPSVSFESWAVMERVQAAGLLSRGAGAAWSVLAKARSAGIPDRLVEEGKIERVTIEGLSRPYLALAGFRRRRFPKADDRMRILGPLDPLLWDRALVRDLFGFDYVWEVYKPATQRKWGWYVCPLLHEERLVGRIEAAIEGDVLRVKNLWKEKGLRFDDDALDATLARHAEACGASRVSRPRRGRRSLAS